jgi:putative hydrolase of the HAD superfamily
MPIRNLIFDFGNVLFDLDLPAIERNLKVLFGKNFAAAKEKLQRARVFELYETGGLSTAEFVETLRTAADGSPTESQVVDAWNSCFLEMPRHRFDLLARLRQRYKVFLLSNINELHERWIADYMGRAHRLADYETRYFDGVYFSHLIRLRKPDPAIYEYVLVDAELDPAECIFFDDLEINVAAARAVGIRAVQHPLGGEIADTLRAAGVVG